MIRKLLSIIPLLTVVASLALSARSGFVLVVADARSTLSAMLSHGELRLSAGEPPRKIDGRRFLARRVPRSFASQAIRWSDASRGERDSAIGFALSDLTPGPGTRFRELVIPGYALVVLAATPMLIAFHRWWRAQRRAVRGLCAQCGFDLRATPERCPECGCHRHRSASDVATGLPGR